MRFSKKNSNRLPMKGKVKTGFRVYCAVVIAVMLAVCCFSVTAFAAGNDALSAINNLSTFIFGLIRAIGLILTGFGIVQTGKQAAGFDPGQGRRAELHNSFFVHARPPLLVSIC